MYLDPLVHAAYARAHLHSGNSFISGQPAQRNVQMQQDSLAAQRRYLYTYCPRGCPELAVYANLATGKRCCPALVSLKVTGYDLAGGAV